MATANFWNFEANSIYAVFHDATDNEDNVMYTIDNIKDELYNIESNVNVLQIYKPINKLKGLPRNFNGYKIVTLKGGNDYGDLSVEFEIDVVVGYGYYQGVNFDYITKIYLDGYEQCDYNEIDDYFDLANFGSRMNSGMLKIQNRNAKKWLKKNVSVIHEQIERTLKEHTSDELKVAGRFSNGEVCYIKV